MIAKPLLLGALASGLLHPAPAIIRPEAPRLLRPEPPGVLTPGLAMPMIMFLAGGRDIGFAYTGRTLVGSGLTTYNVTIGLGTAATDRVVAVILNWRKPGSARTLDSASIDGNAATIVGPVTLSAGSNMGMALVYAAVPGSNTSGTLSLTFSAAMTDLDVTAFRFVPVGSTPVSSATAQSAVAGTSLDVTGLTVKAQGVSIWAVGNSSVSTLSALRYSASETPSTHYNGVGAGGTNAWIVGSVLHNADATGVSMGASRSTSLSMIAVAASWY